MAITLLYLRPLRTNDYLGYAGLLSQRQLYTSEGAVHYIVSSCLVQEDEASSISPMSTNNKSDTALER